MSMSDRSRRVDFERRIRLENQRLENKVPRQYMIFSLLMIPLAVAAGFFVADHQYFLDSYSYEKSLPVQNYTIDGYTIVFTSPENNRDMEGNWGFTYRYRDNDIFINKELLERGRLDLVVETCHHELLHNLGVPSKYHDRIEMYEKQINDPVCIELVERLTGR